MARTRIWRAWVFSTGVGWRRKTVCEKNRLPPPKYKENHNIHNARERPQLHSKSWMNGGNGNLIGRATVLNSTLKQRENNYMTIPVHEIAENVNGPSQQFVGEREWPSARCFSWKTRKIPACEKGGQTMVLREDEQTTRGRELQVPPRLATRGERKMSGWVKSAWRFFLPFWSQLLWVECVWTQGLTVLAPHSQNQ